MIKVCNNGYKKKKLAPVLITAFNRDFHFYKTLDTLSKNKEAKETDLYVSIDGWLTEEDRKKQENIIKTAKMYADKFLCLNINHHSKNLGLSRNITESITSVINQHGKIIVVEDDIIVSRAFLKFMNDSLNYYEKKNKIWHVAAYNIINNKKKKNEIFLWRLMNCWGWGTWKDRWSHYEKNPKKLIENFNKQQISDFNLSATNIYWDQVIDNYEGTIDTWAIFWYATIFKNSGLCVNPWFSYIENIGLDGTGIHYKKDISKNLNQELNHSGVFSPKNLLEEDNHALNIMMNHYKKQGKSIKSLFSRHINKKLKKKIKKILRIN
ncbi:hypothetical protein N8863_06145 [Candidatus Pelagibacter ubique]|nr:hypothetical protein [Candidatus Pelagibacter ubique]